MRHGHAEQAVEEALHVSHVLAGRPAPTCVRVLEFQYENRKPSENWGEKLKNGGPAGAPSLLAPVSWATM
jgi:hypothetical protein